MSIRVRPFSFLGRYPNPDIEIGDDLLLRSGEMLFCCTKNRLVDRYDFGELEPDQPAFELDNWTIQEVRFLSSIYIGNGLNHSLSLYPLPIFRDLEVKDTDSVIEDGSLLSPLVQASKTDGYFMAGNHGLLPDHSNTYDCSLWDERLHEQASIFWNALDVDDPLIIRGLHAILKSEMLFYHFQFRDASIASSHIALDAAFSIVLQRLKIDGNGNPTSADAQAYLDDLWGVPRSGKNFFEDYYRDRIRNFHTDSRYGAEPIASFSIDDIWHLNSSLKNAFYSLVTDELHDEFRESRDEFLLRR